jgi:hypothetical protein
MPPRVPFLFCLAILAISLTINSSAQVRISEFMADNRSTLLDEDDDAPDWIELHHDGAQPLDLLGYTLTDDPALPNKWLFPAVTIEPQGYLLVFASGKNRADPAGSLHTNFSLNTDGDYLALYPPGENEKPLSEWSPIYPPQRQDIAYGDSSESAPVPLVTGRSSCKWLIPFGNSEVLNWTLLDFDDTNWFNGETGIGYDVGLDYHEWIFTDVAFNMSGIATSAYVRIPFQIDEPELLTNLALRIRYDDGFVAYLNGQRIAADAAPKTLTPNATATTDRDPFDGIQEAVFDLTDQKKLLREGDNLLAIHGLDFTASNGDFLVSPTLSASRNVETPLSGYLLKPTPGADNAQSFQDFVSAPTYSNSGRFFNEPFMLAVSSDTTNAKIYLTTDGSIPTPSNGILYEAPFRLDETLGLRARAYKEGCVPSPTTTHTYVFPPELIAQVVLNASVVAANRESMVEAIVDALPIVSINVDRGELLGDGGIHTLPEQSREIAMSMEYFSKAEPNQQFQIDAGLKVHGGDARFHAKKPFRISFRRRYGRASLEFPLFEDSPVTTFNQLILRAGGHDGWSTSPNFGSSSFDLPFHATYLRDQFLRKTELDMGMLSPRGRYVQLLINGVYWGVYDLHERPNASFFANHLGGRQRDWDVLHHQDTLSQPYAEVDGNGAAWTKLHETVAGDVSDSATYAALANIIDPENLIDNTIVRMWSNDHDWAGPVFQNDLDVTVFRNKNWYTGGNLRGDEAKLFQFFTWDAEISMGSHLLVNVFGFNVPQQVTNFDLTSVDDPGTPAGLHSALRLLPDYKRLFGDRVQRYFFNDGALSTDKAQARIQAMIDTLDSTIDLEAARWGDLHFGPNFTRENHWLPEVAWLRDQFIPERTEIFLNQLQARSLYPLVAAPAIEPFGGSLDNVTNGIELGSEDGTIHYTTDGTDPATSPAFIRRILLGAGAQCNYLVPSIGNGGAILNDTWQSIGEPKGFDQWETGSLSLGYDVASVPDFADVIDTAVDEMNGINTSIFVRIPFALESIDTIRSLILRMKYDDGFVAYLNGQRVASRGAPDFLTWNAQATTRRTDAESLFFQDFNVSIEDIELRVGINVLALHGLNGNIVSSDFLLSPQLEVIESIEVSAPSETALIYSDPLTLRENTTVKARVITDDGLWSALSEAHFYTRSMPTPTNLVLTEVHFHPSDPATFDLGFTATDFEFLELSNVGSEPIQLAGLRFSEGIEFEFATDTPTLEANGRILVVNNRRAFIERYGAEIATQIAGEYGNTSRLSNGGETLTLMSGDDRVLFRFTYGDKQPWPSSADGGGVSLVPRNATTATTSDASLWRVSEAIGGSPGQAEPDRPGYAEWREAVFAGNLQAGDPSGNPDQDRLLNLMEYAFARDPLATTPVPNLDVMRSAEGTEIRYTVPIPRDDLQFRIETSAKLSDPWQQAAVTTEIVREDDGSETLVQRLTETLQKTPRFFRLRVDLLFP